MSGPQERGSLPFDTAVATATNFLTNSIQPGSGATTYRVTVAFAAAAKLLVRATDPSATVSIEFNSGAALNPDQLYTFVFGTSGRVGVSYNFRHDLGGPLTVRMFEVDEVRT